MRAWRWLIPLGIAVGGATASLLLLGQKGVEIASILGLPIAVAGIIVSIVLYQKPSGDRPDRGRTASAVVATVFVSAFVAAALVLIPGQLRTPTAGGPTPTPTPVSGGTVSPSATVTPTRTPASTTSAVHSKPPGGNRPPVTTRTTTPPRPSTAAGMRIANEFDVDLEAGYAYDLDLARGVPPATNSGHSGDDPSYGKRDLYRTKANDPGEVDKLLGAQQPITSDNHNRVLLVATTDPPERCRTVTGAGGQILTDDLRVGSRFCVRTWSGRSAMVRVTRLPASPLSPLGVHVILLSP